MKIGKGDREEEGWREVKNSVEEALIEDKRNVLGYVESMKKKKLKSW